MIIIFCDEISRIRLVVYSSFVLGLLVLYVIIDLSIQRQIEGSFGIDWTIFLLFIAYTMIPLPLRVTTLIGITVSFVFVVIVAGTTAGSNDKYSASLIVREVIIILIVIIIIGAIW